MHDREVSMQIVISPDPILRQVAEECDGNDRSLKKLSKQMARAMYKNNGCGLAGPQVGVLKRIIVIDCDVESDKNHPITLINPKIIDLDGDPLTDEEGCLSVPGIAVPIKRQPFAKVSYYDVNGEEQIIEGDGLLGRCLQHEIDHLNGITLFEAADPLTRIKALRDYDEALKHGAKPGSTSID